MEPVHTHKEVVGVRHVSANTEQLHEVVELSVDVTAYLPELCD